MRFSVRAVLFPFLFHMLSTLSVNQSVRAQSQTATLTGVVTDPRGAVIAGAQITATALTSSAEPVRSATANDGRYTLPLLPGRYRVSVSRDSFATLEQEIAVAAGETRELPVRLALEPLSAKVVVTAQSLPLDADSSPAPVTILTRQEVDERGATSLPDLLVTQPGFSLGRTGPEGGSTSLFLDGGNSNYTKVLVDGAPANVPGGFVDFSNFTLDNVDKIEVVHGAESALYGSDAMDGVIQIFTHRGTTRIPEFTAFAEGGNFATGRGGAELSGLLGRFDYSAGVSDLETGGQGPNDAFRDRTLSGNFGWRITDSDRISLALRDNVSDAGTPGQTLLQPADLKSRAAIHDFSASLLASFSTGARWRHQVLGTEFYNRYLDPAIQYFYHYNVAAVTAQSAYVLRDFAFTVGYEVQVENGFIATAANGGISSTETHARRNNQAGFIDARWQPVARLTLNAGGRVEDNAYFGIRGVPRVGASYALRISKGAFGDTRLRAAYGQGIVTPRFDQSYGTDPCFPGNPNLAPEESRSWHAGVGQKLAYDRVRITADYFDNRFHNLTSFGFLTPSPACLATRANLGSGEFFNTDLARARGGNFSGEARIARWLTAGANYTYDATRVVKSPNATDPAEIAGNRLLRRPLNSGSAALNASFRRMNWNLSGYFTGRRTDSDFLSFTQNGVCVGPCLTSNPGYARFDLAASYHFTHGVSFYGRIANLADKQYQDAIGYPALGREFRIGVKYTTHRE